MGIIIATGINELDEQLHKEFGNSNSKIVGYKEYLLKIQEKIDLIILSTKLPGDSALTIKSLLYELKSKSRRIIFITYKDDIDNIIECFSMSIYDLLITSEEGVSKDDIIDLINNPKTWDDVKSTYLAYRAKQTHSDTPKHVIIKEENRQEPKIVEKTVEKRIIEKHIETHIIKPGVVSFYSADNHILCNYLLSVVAKLFKKETRQEVLVIDNDFLPCMDYLFNVDKKIPLINNFSPNAIDTGISACYSSIENEGFSSDLLSKFTLKSKCGVDVLTGLYNDTAVKLMKAYHYEKIIDTAKEIYDLILISTNPFKNSLGTVTSIIKSDKVIDITECNYLSFRNNFTSIKAYVNAGVSKSKFGIVTLSTDHPLDEGITEHVFKEYTLLANLELDRNYNELINSKKLAGKVLFLPKKSNPYKKIISFLGLTNTVIVNKQNIIKSPSSDSINNKTEKFKSLREKLTLPFKR